MSKRIFTDYINDIYNTLQLLYDFTENLDFHQFEHDIKTQYAVIRCFEIIGEAVKKLSYEFRGKYPAVPWDVMAGMRDRLIHGYDSVDVGIVWRTLKIDILPLTKQISDIKEDVLND